MPDNLEDAVRSLTDKAASAAMPDEAMKFAQAALNVAHAIATLAGAAAVSKSR